MARPKKTASATPATAAVKTARKKAASAEKAAPAAVETALYLQTGGGEWNVSDIRERAMAAYTADGHETSGIQKLTVYLKPEEGKAYYVVNDGDSGSIDL